MLHATKSRVRVYVRRCTSRFDKNFDDLFLILHEAYKKLNNKLIVDFKKCFHCNLSSFSYQIHVDRVIQQKKPNYH